MKNVTAAVTTWSILITIICLLLGACKGPQGDPGPQGDAGATGSAGAKGDPNVVYSDWKTINWTVSGEVTPFPDNKALTYYNLSSPATANSLFTKEAITSAAIFTYIKYRTFADSLPGKYKLVERISNDRSVNHYFKIPGRTDATIFDYGFASVVPGGVSENFFLPSIQLNTYTLGTPIPELRNRSADFVRGLVKDLPQFRHVIIYGGVKGGRLAAIDWSNYSEVDQALHLTR